MTNEEAVITHMGPQTIYLTREKQDFDSRGWHFFNMPPVGSG